MIHNRRIVSIYYIEQPNMFDWNMDKFSSSMSESLISGINKFISFINSTISGKGHENSVSPTKQILKV